MVFAIGKAGERARGIVCKAVSRNARINLVRFTAQRIIRVVDDVRTQLIGVARDAGGVGCIAPFFHATVWITACQHAVQIVVGVSDCDAVAIDEVRPSVQNIVYHRLKPSEIVRLRNEQALIVEIVGSSVIRRVDDVRNPSQGIVIIRNAGVVAVVINIGKPALVVVIELLYPLNGCAHSVRHITGGATRTVCVPGHCAQRIGLDNFSPHQIIAKGICVTHSIHCLHQVKFVVEIAVGAPPIYFCDETLQIVPVIGRSSRPLVDVQIHEIGCIGIEVCSIINRIGA